MDNIRRKVEKIVTTTGTDNVEEIAHFHGIQILKRSYSNRMKGYYLHTEHDRFIVVNESYNKVLQKIIIAHELGHAFLHKTSDHPLMFMQDDYLGLQL